VVHWSEPKNERLRNVRVGTTRNLPRLPTYATRLAQTDSAHDLHCKIPSRVLLVGQLESCALHAPFDTGYIVDQAETACRAIEKFADLIILIWLNRNNYERRVRAVPPSELQTSLREACCFTITRRSNKVSQLRLCRAVYLFNLLALPTLTSDQHLRQPCMLDYIQGQETEIYLAYFQRWQDGDYGIMVDNSSRTCPRSSSSGPCTIWSMRRRCRRQRAKQAPHGVMVRALFASADGARAWGRQLVARMSTASPEDAISRP